MSRELKEVTHMEAIRCMSGVINPRIAVDALAFINLIARHYKKLDSDYIEVDEEFLNKTMEKIGFKIVREK